MGSKKTLTGRHVCFADPDGPVERITDQAVALAEAHFTRRIGAVRQAIAEAADFEAAGQALLELAARWTPDALGRIVGDALELAAWSGREAVFAEAEGVNAFAGPGDETTVFREQIDFLSQKRPKPTRVWTDAMHGDHDRAFVIAGATDIAMIEEFQAAVIDAASTRDLAAFGREFDRIVEKYGWSYNGGREWRIRTIFNTNIRTSYMAGRLRQMRDPDVVKLMPWWQYIHADTRVPLNPRPAHVGWDRLVLKWDDPWWNTHFPPNDWQCSCGIRALSDEQLKRLGKTGPDRAPPDNLRPFTHKASGEVVILPEGIGFGWDHMPGDLWERGLVPSALIEEVGGVLGTGRHIAEIDTPSPLGDLLAKAKPFAAKPLPEGLGAESYVRAFLEPFGADIGRAVLWPDATGVRIPVSDEFFRARSGAWKVEKRGRAGLTPLMAEALLDPDEIWIGVAEKTDPVRSDLTELLIDRRYIRVDPDLGIIIVMEIGRRWWEPITIYQPTKKNGKPDLDLLDRRRGGKLLWKRK
jgi:hypothetical protein